MVRVTYALIWNTKSLGCHCDSVNPLYSLCVCDMKGGKKGPQYLLGPCRKLTEKLGGLCPMEAVRRSQVRSSGNGR